MYPVRKSMRLVALCMLLTTSFVQVSFASITPAGRQSGGKLSISSLKYTLLINSRCAGMSGVRSLTIDTGAATPLPLRLMNFTGSYGGQQPLIVLHWTAAVQTGVRTYKVETSHDGVQWQPIGEVGVSALNASDTNHYAFQDLFFNTGDNYYRLKIVAQNNNFCYSPVVIVQIPEGKEGLRIFPNPARTQVHLRWEGEGPRPSALELLTFSGNAVRKETPGASGDCTFSLAQVPAGLYLLKVHYADHDVLNKLVVAH